MQSIPALVFEKVDTVQLQSIDMPDPGEHELQIRTSYSAISAGTEGWMLHGRFTWGTTPFPYVPGYQRAGMITALGPGVKNWRIGERVAATGSMWTGPIPPFSGAHAALSNVPEHEVYRLPAAVDDHAASTVVVAQVGYNAASRLVLEHDDWVIVYGDGLIGQCAAQAARARGAHVVLAGHRNSRLDLANQHSADAVVNTSTEDFLSRVRTLTGQANVTGVIDTVQTELAQRQYLPLLEHGRGQIVYSGFTPGTTWADMALLQQQELTTHFVSGWSRERIEATLTLMEQGALQLRPLITHHVPFTQGPQMYQMIQEKSTPSLGVVLDWKGAEK